MGCKKCNENVESFSAEYYYNEPFPVIVSNGENLFKSYNTNLGIIECKTCSSLWIIEQDEIYFDPRDRSGPPPMYKVKAKVLNSDETFLIKNPSVENLIKLDEKNYHYEFFIDYFNAFPKKFNKQLNKLFEKKVLLKNQYLKLALSNWYVKNNINKIKKKWEGQNSDYQILLQLKDNEQLLAIRSLDNEKLLLVLNIDKRFIFKAISTKNRDILWYKDVPRFWPWMKLINPLKILNDRIISIHIPDDEDGPFIYKPNLLIISDFNGREIFKHPLQWYFNEIHDSSCSQNRIIHNFKFSIFDNLLFFPYKNFLIVADLLKGEILSQVNFSDKDIFTGNILYRNDGLYTAELINGWTILDKNFSILPDQNFIIKSYIVKALSNGNVILQDGTLILINENIKLSLGELQAPPSSKEKTIFLPLSDSIKIISEDGKILNQINGKVLCSFSEHENELMIQSLLSDNFYAALTEENKLILLNLNGKKFGEIDIKGFPIALGLIDSNIFYVIYFNDSNANDYAYESNYYLSIYNNNLNEIHNQKILTPDFFTFDAKGVLYIYERFLYETNYGVIKAYKILK